MYILSQNVTRSFNGSPDTRPIITPLNVTRSFNGSPNTRPIITPLNVTRSFNGSPDTRPIITPLNVTRSFNGSPDTRPIITPLNVCCPTGKYSRPTVTRYEPHNRLLGPSDSDQYVPRLIRIFASHMKKAFIHRYLESTQSCLNKLGGYTG